MRAYFPLRSNAAGLLTTTAGQLVRRVKLASLVGDVFLEDGTFTAHAGPDGSFEGWSPRIEQSQQGFQTPRERRMLQKARSHVSVGKDDGLMYPILDTPTSIYWRSTFAPIKKSLDRAYPWITFGYLQDGNIDEATRQLVKRDNQAGVLSDEPVAHVRQRILEHAARDTVMASGLDAVLVTDIRHGEVLHSRVVRQQAAVVPTYLAAGALNPDVDALAWSDIDELRRLPGWSQLRAVWTDVGEMVLPHVATPTDFDTQVQRAFIERMAEAAAQVEGPRRRLKIGWKIFDLLTGIATNLAGLNPVVSIGVDLALAGTEEALNYTGALDLRWIAAHNAVSRRILERRAAELDER